MSYYSVYRFLYTTQSFQKNIFLSLCFTLTPEHRQQLLTLQCVFVNPGLGHRQYFATINKNPPGYHYKAKVHQPIL